MKKLYTILVFLIITTPAIAQNRNLNDIRKKFLEEFNRLEKQGKIEEGKEGDGLRQQFRRWEYIMKSRTYPSGIIPDGTIQWREWERYQSTHADQFAGHALFPQWQQVGTNVVPAQGGGAGRVNVIRLDPSDTNIMYAGAASGGVWKSIDGGSSWFTNTDKYPVTSIADIAIDATNGNNIYVATGDGAGYEVENDDFWGGVYTAGILRSTDGGDTWAQVARELPQDLRTIIQRLIINPLKSNILLAATRQGIYRTTNGGTSWKKVLNHHCYDIEWNTANPNIVYAGGDGVLYTSINAGATWTRIRSGLGEDRMSIEVSKSNPLVIYTLTGSTFYRSGNGGITWTLKSYPSAFFYGYYDLVLSCAGANSDYLIAGGLSTVKSTDGGNSWTFIDNGFDYTAPNYVHVDKHAAIFYPASTAGILLGTDGGVFKTTNGGTTWSDLSNRLMIAQIYRLGTTPQNVNLITSGWQDNGCNKWDGTNWTRIFGGDGMETAIDYTNQNTIYACYQYGGLNRSNDGGSSWTYDLAPSSGDWITPFVIDPVVNTRLYYAGTDLYKSENRGDSWSVVRGVKFKEYAQAIAVAPSNNNIIYAASLNEMYRIDISTGIAKVITAGLPVNKAGINYITVNGNNPDKVWVAFAGYSDGNKVYRSSDGGSSWTNVSGSLPNLPVNTIVCQNNSNSDRVYIGTDIGVYTTNNILPDWICFSNKLPNVMVHELEINYASNKLVAATYGRGIWQVNIQPGEPQQIVKNNVLRELEANVFPNPATDMVNIQVQNAKTDVLVNVYKLTGEKVGVYHFSAEAAKAIRINLNTQPFGNYILHLQSGEATTTKTIQLNK